jgi:hypothetical protein
LRNRKEISVKYLREQVQLLSKLALSEDPVERDKLKKRIEKAMERARQPETLDDVLAELGIPDSVAGHRYLVRAIQLQMECSTPVPYHKWLIPTVAKDMGISETAVERGVQHCIELCFERSEPEIILKYFGYAVDPDRGKVGAKQFVVRIANIMRERNDGHM